MTSEDDSYRKAGSGKPIALEEQASEAERLYSPSAARNKDVLRDTLLSMLVPSGTVLEIAAGTGEHAAHFAAACPHLHWQPTDPDAASRASIDAWRVHSGVETLQPPLAIDTTQEAWWQLDQLPDDIQNIVCINMIHIAPFAAAEGLLDGAAALLPQEGRLFFYGPFKRHGETAPSNHSFDESLKSRDERWGVRDLDLDIIPLAGRHGLSFERVVEMPANNLTVMFEKTG
jgi:hypothetical protein